MKRPVTTVADEKARGGAVVLVPLGPESKHVAKLDLPSWQRLQMLGYHNLNFITTPRGNIYATVPSKIRGVKVMVARILTQAMQSEIVRFKNGDTLDLRSENLEKQTIRKNTND